MNVEQRYSSAKVMYANIGVDTDSALDALADIPISMHCWQGDDIAGFDNATIKSGGIQATGNYPGCATTPAELMHDIDTALNLIPGKHKLNLHASYAIFTDQPVDRDELKPCHFEAWADFAHQRGMGIDFNPTFFGHPKAENGTLSSPCDETRDFWIRHAIRCLEICEYFYMRLKKKCLMNIWIPDGFKNTPSDRMSPRTLLKNSLDRIMLTPFDLDKVTVSLESKLFGIGMESYTVGSHEFYMNYAAKNPVLCLLDNGHFHPTESVADKISSMLLFNEKVALHVTRGVRWDSDHVVLLDDQLKEIAAEIIKNDPKRVFLGMDFFDASINRIAAWVIGMRNMQKALLAALLQPNDRLASLQEKGDFTQLMALQEEYKLYPVGDVWDYFCSINKVPMREEWLAVVKQYEEEVLLKRVKEEI